MPMDSETSVRVLTEAVLAFRDARDWQQFHSPRNLAAALAIEAGELQETLLWKSDDQVREALAEPHDRQRIADELADIVTYTLLFADATGIDVSNALLEKLKKNAQKYPIEKVKGSSRKYTDYRDADAAGA